MADVEYSVAAILQLHGDAQVNSRLAATAGHAQKASSAISDIGRKGAAGLASVGQFIGGAIDKLGLLTIAAGTAGAALVGAAGLGAAKVGLIDVNAKLEDATLGFGTLFNMFGAAPNLSGGLGMAQTLIEQIREDAKSLPGEFSDFVAMSQTLTAPLLNAGKGLTEIRGLTRDTVIAAASLGINFDQASREMAMLMEGHAGGHNILGTRLGITTSTQVAGKEFNKASQGERFDYITEKLKPAQQSLGMFARSWGGLTSTIIDSVKQFLGAATQPLFERLKFSMANLLTWQDKHKDKITQVGAAIGQFLVAGYDRVEKMVLSLPQYLVPAREAVLSIGHALKEGFDAAWPIIQKVIGFLSHELEKPGGAGHMLKSLVALRVGAALATQAPSMLNMGLGAGRMLMGAGGAAEGAAAGAAGGLGMGAGAAAAAIALPVMAVATAAIDNTLGSWDRLVETFSGLTVGIGSAFAVLTEKGGLFRDALGLLGSGIVLTLQIAIYPFTLAFEALAVVGKGANEIWSLAKTGISLATDALGLFVDGMGDVATSTNGAIAGMLALVTQMAGMESFARQLERAARPKDYYGGPSNLTAAEQAFVDSGDGGGKRPIGKTSSTNVDARGSKIEIKLDVRDQDPDRIVRRMFDEIGKRVARPGTSPTAPSGAA